jgi:hypothetical protein
MTEDKGQWAEVADEGIVPDDLGEERQGGDPELPGSVVGREAESDEPATEEGIDPSAGDRADATADGGPEVPDGAEPDLKDVAAAAREADKQEP